MIVSPLLKIFMLVQKGYVNIVCNSRLSICKPLNLQPLNLLVGSNLFTSIHLALKKQETKPINLCTLFAKCFSPTSGTLTYYPNHSVPPLNRSLLLATELFELANITVYM